MPQGQGLAKPMSLSIVQVIENAHSQACRSTLLIWIVNGRSDPRFKNCWNRVLPDHEAWAWCRKGDPTVIGAIVVRRGEAMGDI